MYEEHRPITEFPVEVVRAYLDTVYNYKNTTFPVEVVRAYLDIVYNY